MSDDRFAVEVRRLADLISSLDPVIGAMIREHAAELGTAMAVAYPGYFVARRT